MFYRVILLVTFAVLTKGRVTKMSQLVFFIFWKVIKMADGTVKVWVCSLKVKSRNNRLTIQEHPYYQALQHKNRKLYESFVDQSVHQKAKHTASWEGFITLGKTIKKHGFICDAQDPIIIKFKHNQWYVSHGRHRACILLYLYGQRLIFSLSMIKKNRYLVSGLVLSSHSHQ